MEISSYLGRLRPYLGASIVLLAAGALLGVLAIPYAPALAQSLGESIGGFVKLFRELPKPQLALAIFFNNAMKTLVVIFGGLLLGIIPVIFLIVNGGALGFVLYLSIQQRGLSDSLMAILPHGVLELPAVLLGTSLGLLLGGSAIKKLSGTAALPVRRELALALRLFAVLIVPLLALAALVESFVTSALMEM
jgi:stage II sporulation protein M